VQELEVIEFAHPPVLPEPEMPLLARIKFEDMSPERKASTFNAAFSELEDIKEG